MRVEVYPATKGRWRWRFGTTTSRLFDTRGEALRSIRKSGTTATVVLLRKDGKVAGELYAPRSGDAKVMTLLTADEYSEALDG